VAVVTGGHPYDAQGFHRLWRSLPNIDAYIQHMDNFSATADSIGLSKDNPFHPAKARKEYDVVVFFSFLKATPTDEGLPWYCGAPKSALDELMETDQGIFVLHHALLAYPDWPVFSEIIGIEDRKMEYYSMDEKLHIQIANPNHPITKGLEPFDCVEESYKMKDAGEGSDILLTVNNPKSMRTIGWTRQYRKHRVFCLELGHDELGWANPSFRALVERGVRWCANR
jgi:hypothetical protein